MNIVHLGLDAPYNEGWGYQENLLPKYQAKAGHNVTLIVSNRKHSSGGSFETVEPEDYISPDGFRVIRLDYIHYFLDKLSRSVKFYKIYGILKNIKPDLIMQHGLNNTSVLQAIKYIKKINPECKIIADNHLDYNIGAHFLRKKIGSAISRNVSLFCNRIAKKYYSKVYGVTPWRIEFCEEIYKIKKEKLDLLPAGADDEKIDYDNKDVIKKNLREKYDIKENDFLIVTGGKIDKNKNIDSLMQAVSEIDNQQIKLLVFGNTTEDIKERINSLSDGEKVKYIGWISSDDTYNYFLAADLVFFPGQHSVMWEQSVVCGTPLVVKHYEGMHHCDVGGNCEFLYDDSVSGIKELVIEIVGNKEKYSKMLSVAQSDLRKQFLYSELAKKSVEVIEGE